MNAFARVALTALAGLGLAAPASAAVLFPQFDVVNRAGDAGVAFADGVASDTFTLDATVISLILSPGDTVNITDVDFFLTATFTDAGNVNARSGGIGSFRVGDVGSELLTGTFSDLQLIDLSTPNFVTLFQANLFYTGGSYAGSLTEGRIEGQYTTTGDPSLLATHTGALGSAKVGPVVPVPAALWLLGSAIASGLTVARRRSA